MEQGIAIQTRQFFAKVNQSFSQNSLMTNCFPNLARSITLEYQCSVSLDLYDKMDCKTLATQAKEGRHLSVVENESNSVSVKVKLVEDGYQAWLPLEQLSTLQPVSEKYQPIALTRLEIEAHLPEIIAYTQAAKEQPNYYLWGGTLGPNYDCSGLMQAAFAASGIWLPRDSYQQEAFTERVAIADLLPGDLIFFGSKRVDHVALHLGDRYYIHSSGKAMGRNGIGIDILSPEGDEISQNYYQKWWSCGRVMDTYRPN
ncbi:MAG: C40 family peptidase [Snowella sp.]|nr:C40 family peptidase [Snowella sp.]